MIPDFDVLDVVGVAAVADPAAADGDIAAAHAQHAHAVAWRVPLAWFGEVAPVQGSQFTTLQ